MKSLARAPRVQLLSFFEEKKFINRIFSQHRLLGEKRKDTWICEDKKIQRTPKKSPKNRELYLLSL